jgi:uncharacterized protein (DUF1015 family)
MAQIAWFRGALWDPKKVELAHVVSVPIEGTKSRFERGELVRDSARAVYRYHLTFSHDGRPVTRKQLVVALRLEPWTEGVVRPHEATDPHARELAVGSIDVERVHTDAVLLGYHDAAGEADRVFRRAESKRPDIDVTTPDGTQHRLWRVANAEVLGKLRPLFAPKKLHVLDGHARYEGMLALRDKLVDGFSAPPSGGAARSGEAGPFAGAPMYSSAHYGLACLVELGDPALVVGARHRVVRGLSATRDDVLTAARAWFVIDKLPGAARDAAKQRAALADTLAHQPAFVLAFAGDPDAWKLTLSPDVSPTRLGIQVDRAVQKYVPVVVDELLLAKVAPKATRDTVIDAPAALAALESGADMAVIMRPLSLDQLLHADELGQTLPFGSSAFLPEVARLVSFVVDRDEDLL